MEVRETDDFAIRDQLSRSQLVLERVLFSLGLGGIPAVFLPFAHRIAPLEPFPFLLLLPFAISISSMTVLLGRSMPRAMWIVGYGIALGSAGFIVTVFYEWHFGPLTLIELPSVGLGLALLVVGAATSLRHMRLGLSHARNAMNAMQFSGIAFATPFLIDYWRVANIGFYVSMLTTAAYIGQIVLCHRIARQNRSV